jgi:hypothetical protein
MKILMVLTSNDVLGSTGPKGGQPPLDPKSDLPDNRSRQ